MSNFVLWLEAHDKLAGWAQFFGTMLALAVTYATAFFPIRRRKQQLRSLAARLLGNGYEVIESYHRTSANFLPTSISLRAAVLSMDRVADEIDRFPISELDDHGPRSVARHLISTAFTLKGLKLVLEPAAVELEGRTGTEEDKLMIRQIVGDQMKLVEAMITGAELKRPEWPSSC